MRPVRGIEYLVINHLFNCIYTKTDKGEVYNRSLEREPFHGIDISRENSCASHSNVDVTLMSTLSDVDVRV
jgi:hypothetical protein